LLGEFGRIAMQTRDHRQILQQATEPCAQGLEASFAKVLEYMPDESRLMVRAGVGWTWMPSITSLSLPSSDLLRRCGLLGPLEQAICSKLTTSFAVNLSVPWI